MNPEIYDDYISTQIEKKNFKEVFWLIKKICKNKKNINILDFCCGTGTFARLWLTKIKNIRYEGVDINDEFINFAKRKVKDSRFRFITHDALSFHSKEKFDIILATSAYHHIIDKKKRNFLQNIYNHLQDDGFLIIYEKILDKFSNKIEAIDVGTKFYLERIKYMVKTEKINKNQMFALFNEQYLTSIRQEEYKIDYEYFASDIKATGFAMKKVIKMWPKSNIFKNKKVGDFIFLLKKYQK